MIQNSPSKLLKLEAAEITASKVGAEFDLQHTSMKLSMWVLVLELWGSVYPGVCCWASLAYSASPRPVRELVLKNKNPRWIDSS